MRDVIRWNIVWTHNFYTISVSYSGNFLDSYKSRKSVLLYEKRDISGNFNFWGEILFKKKNGGGVCLYNCHGDQLKIHRKWYHLVESSIPIKAGTPNKCWFDSLCGRYPRKTGISRNGGHFGRHLGFWEMYTDSGLSPKLFWSVFTRTINGKIMSNTIHFKMDTNSPRSDYYYIDIDRDGHEISRFGGLPRELYFPKGLYFPEVRAQHWGKI